MRDRLIKLLYNAHHSDISGDEAIADYLLANGVIVPPCKVGDKIFFIVNMSEHLAFNDFVTDDTVTKIGVTTKGILHEKGVDFTDFGKTVFLTREEAESKLRKGQNDER